MHYVFAILVVLNGCLLGYYVIADDGIDNASANKAKSSLTKEVTFKNSSKDIPPIIGTAK